MFFKKFFLLKNLLLPISICIFLFSFHLDAQPLSGTSGREAMRATITWQQAVTASAVSTIGITKNAKVPKKHKLPRNLPVPFDAGNASDVAQPEVITPAEINSPSPPTAANFEALPDNNTSIPPDVHGAVGVNHLMTTLNSQVRIQDKSGVTVSTASLDGFWTTLGTPDAFDPKIMYDPYNNRWMFTCVANAWEANSAILIGVTATNDPTGTWYLFSVDAHGSNLSWADYPSIGFNKDWIAVQVNMFTMGGAFDNSNVYIFKKSDLYANVAATHTLVALDASFGGTQVPAHTFDNSLTTLYLIQDWNGNSSGSGYLRLYTITGTVGSEVVTPGAFVVTANPWQEGASSGTDFAPQLGTANKIATNDSRIQNVVYRNGSLWTTHTIFLPASGTTTRSSVQWWEVSTAGAIVQRGRVDDATNTNFYAFPSIGVNSSEEVVLGYSKFSSSIYASASYSYRSSTDAASTLRDEALLKAGENTYYKKFTGTENRWGDYTNTCVDPTNDLDLWTIQEYASATANRWGTWWGKIATPVVPFSGASAPDYRNDNASSGVINLGFTFTLYGTSYTQAYINNNGNISFGSAVATATPTTFPAVSASPMIAPFWADVDTRGASSGLVYYVLGSSSLSVIWNGVGYNNQHADKVNTFTLTITDGTDATIGVGNNVRFTYGDMQWTTGDASGGSSGYGGTAATAGINKGDGSAYILLGRFDNSSEADFLDNKTFTYDVSSTSSIADWTNRYDYSLKKAEDVGFAIPTVAKKLAHSLAVDAAGNSYVAGYSDGGTGKKFDYVTIKYDAFGNKFWSSRYNYSSVNKDDKAYAVTVDASGNVYVTGESDGGTSKMDALTVKYDPLGNELWTARYNNGTVNKKEAGYAIGLSPAGDVVYIAGETDGGTATKNDYLIVAYATSNGTQLWATTYNGSSNKVDKAYALVVDNSGNVIVTGESDGGITKTDYATVKYTGGAGGGSVVAGWPSRYNQSSKKDYGFAVTVDGSGNVYVTGASESSTKFDYGTVKYNSGGVQQWASVYNSFANKNDAAYALTLDGSGNVYVTGASEGSVTKYDYATVKYNSSGAQQWEARYNGGKNDYARSIVACDAEAAVFVTGGSEQGSTKKFDYITQRLAMMDGTSEWVGDYNSASSKNDVAYNIAAAASTCALIVAGTSDGGTTKLDIATVHGSPDAALPVSKTTHKDISSESELNTEDFILSSNYPNPFNPVTVISYQLQGKSVVSLKVFNVLGQEIATLINNEEIEGGRHETTFNATGLSSGVYFYHLHAGNEFAVRKMLLVR
ncbi:MAG: T9SS type A sorting domain-containing protein [Ignavibacteriae bacterium]|nr:T9SS type A sorting domain-containing protein [Ignavibacteriota bacterium]